MRSGVLYSLGAVKGFLLFWYLELSVRARPFWEDPSSLLPDRAFETQKAPSRIALTNTKAAHTASTLSFIAISTRQTSIAVQPNNISRKADFFEASRLLQRGEDLCGAISATFSLPTS